jgi:16S rRNA processing protein RimM
MQIDFQGKEILIPAVDEFLKEVDRERKIIHIDAPDGLIDIYL